MTMRFGSVVTLLGCLVLSRAHAQELEIEKPDASERLAEAHQFFQKWQGGDGTEEEKAEARVGFTVTLQKLAPLLQAVPVEVGPAKKYHKLTLNAAKKQLDAIVFKTPAGKTNFDMEWEFVTPPDSFRSWYILPRDGAMEGFKRFFPQNNHAEEGADLPKENFRVVQPLTGGHLKPNQEYIIWFSFPEGAKPVDFHIRIGLTETPPEAVP